MPDPHPNSPAFETLARELLNQGLSVRFEAHGASMSPVIRDREVVIVTPVIVSKLRKGDIVLTKGHSGFRVHRLVLVNHHENLFITRGDCGQQDDPPVRSDQIFGVVLAKEVRLGKKIVRAQLKGIGGKLLQGAARGQRVAGRLLRKAGWLRSPRGQGKDPGNGMNVLLGTLLVILAASAASFSQTAVAVDTDASTSATADLTGPGTKTVTFTHSTTATANRALIVGVSMDIANSPTAAVTGVTYNGTALSLVGAHNDSTNTRRVEQWYLLNPASGTNLAVVVSVSVPASATIGVAAGATVFTDVDQTVPLSSFVSNDGQAAANSQLDVPSVINGMVFDTLAVGLSTVGVNGPQVQQWNVTSGGTTPVVTREVVGTASSRSGAPSVPISESFSEAFNLTQVAPNATAYNLTSVAPTTITLTLASANNATGGNTTYNGTITGGTGNAYVGDTVVIAGFTNGKNNGTFICTASTTTTITVNNTAGVLQIHAGTAVVTTSTVYNGTITGGTGNAYAGDTVVVAGFTNASNNGTFTATASTATTITLKNTASVAETDPGIAAVETAASSNAVYLGAITGGANNTFAGLSFTISGFTNAGNNGTFTCSASTALSLTCANSGAAAETDPGTASTSSTLNWSLGAVSVNPSTADIGVTTAVGSAIFVGQNTTYTITVKNNGTSAANTTKLSDTLATGMTLVSVTPSAGTTCVTTANPIVCTLPTPLASGATATITVVETATAAGSFANTAVVSDSGTPPDPNSGNNTYVAVATVQSAACANTSQAAPGTNLTNVLNTYYPGTASVVAGAKSIPVGTPTGAGAAIAAGNLLLIIQMQDASINDANGGTYGNGSTGQGFTNLNSAGDYEFVTATGAISGGAVPVTGTGTGGGTVFAYHSSAWSATAGKSSYQVIVVPQYTTASFSATTPPTALAWNGSTGGVLVLDTSSTLTLNGATISIDGMGFRGGAGLQLGGGVGGNNTDYLHAAPTTYTGALENGVDAPKGEGIAGTPLWVESGGTYLNTGTDYPSGTAGTDGSSAHGAPGNGGGGGTDGDPTNNDENAGGGGGGNGGGGGFGGDSWQTNLSVGGEGGGAMPATINRVAMGGGGGAGTRNNSDGDTQASSGSAGGGIIIIRTYGLVGTGTLTANGINAYNLTSNDAGGGAGAAGSIVVLSANGGESGLTIQANGGNGGNAWASQPYDIGDRHGPGGGGGGGVVLMSGAPASVSVSGGSNGFTLNPGVAYGATSGAVGFTVTNESITQTSGVQSGAQCTPDMTLAKSHVGNFTRGLTASYAIPVSNLSPYGPSSGTVTVNDTLPVGLTPTSASGTGWTCSIASQTVSCINSTSLAASSSYPSITVNANVLQTAPSTETNIAQVSGGGEVNLTNDTATDVASVGSTADLSVTNTATPDPVSAGGNITYTQALTNSGPSAADNATLVQAVPANSTFVSINAPAGWSCTTPYVGSTGNVICTALSMTGGTAATFSMVVKVNTGVANGTVLTDTATASSSVSDPNSVNNTASAATVVGPASTAEITVTNVASPNPVVAGSDITYTQVATNVGTGTATNPSLVETVPANTTFVSLVSPPGTTCTPTLVVGSTGTTTCSAPSAPSGSLGTVTFVVKVNTGVAAGTIITDTATANATNQAFGANSAVATDVVASSSSQADVALSTSATPLTVYPGNDITYIQTVMNNGPATASNLSFTEAVPTNTTFASISTPAGWACTTPAVGATGNINCTATSMASGTSANIVIVVNLASTVSVASITASSSVTASTSDPTTANNSTTTVTTVLPVCDLTVTNSGTPSPVQPNNDITYTQVVTNPGPSNCSTVTFSEPIPTNTTFVSMPTPSGWSCTTTGSISCTISTYAPGASTTFTLKVLVSNSAAPGTLITDTATGTTTTHDSNTANNSATVTIGVASGTQADLSVTSSASPNPVAPGSTITYTQTATNAGPAAASTVTFSETLPANTTVGTLAGPAGWTCSTVTLTCTTASFAANTTANFTYTVGVNANTASGSTITQTASIASSVTGDPNPGNNSASTVVYVSPSADLSLINTANPVPVQAGGTITYTQVVSNAGPSNAATATLTETTPANTTFGSITIPTGWSCTTPAAGGTGTISCTNPSFAIGSSSFTVVLNVPAGTAAGTAINNTATASSSTSDPNGANNTATAADVVATATQADLVVTNSASPTSVAAGSNVTYTQSMTNKGPASATTPSFTQTTPPNTNFQSMTGPAGWICTNPGIGNAGTITCTATTLAVNSPANFTLVLQVNSNTASGTNIGETDTATASNIVPNLTNNSATANVVVANANSANVTILKTATPSPNVPSRDTLVYTLALNNTGPASATNVTVTDPLPSDVMWLSSSSTLGSCSQADGTVTCLLGTMTNGASATITILTLAGAPGTATNTASVTADQMTSPNTSTEVETITAATSVKLQSFSAQLGTDKSGTEHAILFWKTGGESHNLGFNVYRDENGERVQINPSLIAGSALLMTGALPRHSGKTYSWIDPSVNATNHQYWLEDVDVNGTRTLHGPVSANASAPSDKTDDAATNSPLLNQLSQTILPAADAQGHRTENTWRSGLPTQAQHRKQLEIAGNPAVKILVKHEGWYRVTQPELIAAGLDPNVDPSLMHLYAEAIEQPIQITGASAGHGGFGSQAALSFYGTGIDTQFTGTRVYFLTAEDSPGQRIQFMPPSTGSNQPPASFPYSVELTPHTTYFSALTTAKGNNFFGPLVSTTPVEETMQIAQLDPNSIDSPQLEVILQGVILAIPHDVTIALNGTTLGDVNFTGEDKGKFNVAIPPGVLQNGTNTITLTAEDGAYDYSLVQSIHITYPRFYIADTDQLIFSGRPGDELTIAGFKQAAVGVFDITDPDQPVQLSTQVNPDPNTKTEYAVALQVPWTTSNPASSTLHTLMAVAADRIASPEAIHQNHSTHWHEAQQGSEIVMISAEAFAGSLTPIVQAHKAEGKTSAVALINDLYDEFNFGEHSPLAIRDFMQTAVGTWQTAPKYLLLNGRASMDPRNYLGFGDLDFVPTKLIPTTGLMTASDDWFSDFHDTGLPSVATGRLPVSTLAEAQLVAGKISTYEGQSTNGPWTSQAMMVADLNDTENFTKDSQVVQAQLPVSINVTDVYASTMGIPQAAQALVTGINSGQLLVNYSGHGSEDMWSGSDLFDNSGANALTNGTSLPVFLIMDCLNGFFQDVYDEPLAVTLMLAPNGGAVAALASSGLNSATPQTILDKLVVQSAMGKSQLALGDAIVKAKSGISDMAVRKTYNLLGDPAMQIKIPGAPAH